MITEDLWTAEGPTAAELKVLERLGRRRQALEALAPADDGEAHVLARSLTTLDDMEECLCEEGAKAPYLTTGWRVLDQLAARLTERTEACVTAPESCRAAASATPRRSVPRSCRSAGTSRQPHPPRAHAARQPKEIRA